MCVNWHVQHLISDNQITVDVGVAIGFGVGCIAFGAMLVLLSFYMFVNCYGSKVTAKN